MARAAGDGVWFAVHATRRVCDRDRRAHRLCRMLGFGLFAVTPSSGRVEVLAEPPPYRPAPHAGRRAVLLREHARRQGDPTPGGSTRQPALMAYRQAALRCADALRDGSRRTRDRSALELTAPRLLLHNVYGCFALAGRAICHLAPAGIAAIAGHPRPAAIQGPTG